jgi:hypothetical protein
MGNEIFEWATASDLLEILAGYDPNEIISYNVYGKADVEDDLGCEITEEQWKKFLTDFQDDDYLNHVRADTWLEALENLREELGIE